MMWVHNIVVCPGDSNGHDDSKYDIVHTCTCGTWN